MSQYFNSNNIKVYPSAKRNPQYNYPANLNTEQNIVSLSNSIVDIKNYIVDGLDISVTDNHATINSGKCVINGYSIEISDNQTISESLSTNSTYYIYLTANTVNINISQGSVNFNISEISGIDSASVLDPDNYKYTGINIEVLTSEKSDLSKSILLGKLSYSNNWVIEEAAKNLKFDSNKTQLSIYKEWGLSKTLANNQSQEVYKNSLQSWLANDFIIDDGNIIE